MALRVNPISAQLGKLSLGISRASIRFSHSSEKDEVKRRQIEASQYQPHHGEKIWIFNHFLDGMTVYSHSPVVKAHKALRQIPFNGKKLKPSKFRKDYWRPLAMIQFPEGYGEVGRSVFQRLRECKSLHELSWDDSLLYDKDGKPRTKHERGKALNNQKANTIADMAAVLAGRGKGNKMWMLVPEDAEDLANVVVTDKGSVLQTEEGTKALVKAEVWWTNDVDRKHALRWSSNVSHYRFDQAGLEELSAEGEVEREAGSESQTALETLTAAEQSQKGADEKASF